MQRYLKEQSYRELKTIAQTQPSTALLQSLLLVSHTSSHMMFPLIQRPSSKIENLVAFWVNVLHNCCRLWHSQTGFDSLFGSSLNLHPMKTKPELLSSLPALLFSVLLFFIATYTSKHTAGPSEQTLRGFRASSSRLTCHHG